MISAIAGCVISAVNLDARPCALRGERKPQECPFLQGASTRSMLASGKVCADLLAIPGRRSGGTARQGGPRSSGITHAPGEAVAIALNFRHVSLLGGAVHQPLQAFGQAALTDFLAVTRTLSSPGCAAGLHHLRVGRLAAIECSRPRAKLFASVRGTGRVRPCEPPRLVAARAVRAALASTRPSFSGCARVDGRMTWTETS